MQHGNDQLQRQLYEYMQLRNLHRRRRHGYLHDRLRAGMHHDRWTDNLLGLLQRPMQWGLLGAFQLRSCFFRRLQNGLLRPVLVRMHYGAGNHKLRDRLRDKLHRH